MAVVPISIASLTHISNDLTLLDIISVRHRQLAHVGIQGINSIAVADLDMNAISVVLTHRLHYRAGRGCPNDSTPIGPYIHTGMPPIAVNPAGNMPPVHRPDKAAGTAGSGAAGGTAEHLDWFRGANGYDLIHRLFQDH